MWKNMRLKFIFMIHLMNKNQLLVNKIYDENNIYSVQNDLLKAVSTFFERDFSIKYERNLHNLILFSPKLKFLIQSKNS